MDNINMFIKNMNKYFKIAKVFGKNKSFYFILLIIVIIRGVHLYLNFDTVDLTLFFNEQSSLYFEIGIFLMATLNYFFGDKEEVKKDLVLKTIKKTNEINLVLEEMRSRQKADYVSISMFHNGEVTFSRIHLLKMTRLFEAYGSNKVARININQTMTAHPLLPYYNSILDISNKGYVYVKDANKSNDETLKNILLYFNVDSALYIPIYDFENDLIGFICFEWDKKTNFNQQKINSIRNEYKYIQHFFFK